MNQNYNTKYKQFLFINFFTNQTNKMKKEYTSPQIYAESVVVENGIAVSITTWGDAGLAGQKGYVFDYDGDEL